MAVRENEFGKASRPSCHRDGDVTHREVGVPDEERPGRLAISVEQHRLCARTHERECSCGDQILLGVFGKGWVGPGSWLVDAVIHNLIGSVTPMCSDWRRGAPGAYSAQISHLLRSEPAIDSAANQPLRNP